MNSEEFDNRLRNTFRDEFEPPREGLWQNILDGLEQEKKSPVWYWLVPVLVLVVSGIMWLTSSLFDGDSNKQAQAKTTVVADSSQTGAGNSNSKAPVIDGTPSPIVTDKQKNSQDNGSVARPHDIAADNSVKHVTDAARHNTRINPRNAHGFNNIGLPDHIQPQHSGNSNNANAAVSDEEVDLAFNRSYPDFSRHIHFSDAAQPYLMMALGKKKENIAPEENNTQYAPKASKWLLNVGFGPQISYNSLAIKNDSQAYIHKDLWANKQKVTHNGSGFHAHGSVMYRLGKSNKHAFIFEGGLFMTYRTENIRMNEGSYDIAHREASIYSDDYNKIDTYMRQQAWIRYNGNYTKFDVVEAFTSIANNKYWTATIPLRLQFEQRISANSFFALGAGAGLSTLYSHKSSHLNLITQKQTEMKSSVQLSGSWNASFALYTNYNGIGQVGVFTSYQSYANPWMLSGKQYGIRMSDLQFGFMFRAPLFTRAKSVK